MKKDNTNNFVLIIIGIAAVVIVSQLFAGTFNNFNSFSKSISKEYHLLKAQKNKAMFESQSSIAQNTSSPDVFGYEKPLETTGKSTSSPIHEDDNITSLALTKKEQPKETLKETTKSFKPEDNKVLASQALKNMKPEKSSSDVRIALNQEKESDHGVSQSNSIIATKEDQPEVIESHTIPESIEEERERIFEDSSPIVERDTTVLSSNTINIIDSPIDTTFRENYSENNYQSDPYTFEEIEENDLIERDNEESNDRYEEPDEHYDISVWRNISSGGMGDVAVDLSIHVDSSPPNGLILTEYIPKGWDLLESSPPYRNFNSSSGEVKWIFIGDEVGSTRINYKVKREGATSSATFHGTYMYNNPDGKHISLQIDGANGV